MTPWLNPIRPAQTDGDSRPHTDPRPAGIRAILPLPVADRR
jgi:hypothetical protein